MRANTIGFGALCGLLAAVVAACGGDSEDGLESKSVPIDDVPKLYAGAACKSFESCLGAAVMEIFLGGESCTATTEAAINDELPRLKQAIEKGTVVYTGTKVDACISAIEKRGCGSSGEPEECTAALDGTIAVGSDCEMDAECVGGDTYCKTDSSCPGKCAARELAGGSCKRDSNCAAGLVCSDATDKCLAPAKLGAACEGGGSAPECELGGFCIGSDDQAQKTGTCKSMLEAFAGKEGDACYFPDKPLCATDLRCIVAAGSTGQLEGKCGKPYASGAACQLAIPDACPSQEYCKAPPNSLSGTCSPRLKAGEFCAKLYDDDLCAANTRCDNGTCRPLQSLGGQCSTDQVCYSESCVGGGCAPAGSCK